MPKFWDQKCLIGHFLTKTPLFGYFWARIFKKAIVIFEISTLNFVYLQNLAKKKQKCLNLEQKMSYLGKFGIVIKKTTVILEINTLKYVYLQNFAKK